MRRENSISAGEILSNLVSSTGKERTFALGRLLSSLERRALDALSESRKFRFLGSVTTCRLSSSSHLSKSSGAFHSDGLRNIPAGRHGLSLTTAAASGPI